MEEKRQKELEEEARLLVDKSNEARQVLTNCETRFIEIRGILKEANLGNASDSEKEAEEPKKAE